MASYFPPDLIFLRERAYNALESVGDASLGQWESWNEEAGVFHLRRRLTNDEQARVGDVEDIRGTKEAEQRQRAMYKILPPEYRIFVD
jgi:hypothetical protein